MNSSPAPLGPLVRNSLMTILVAEPVVAGDVFVAVAVLVFVGMIVGVFESAIEVAVRFAAAVPVRFMADAVPVRFATAVTVNGSMQSAIGLDEFRAEGVPVAKSALLLSVSVQPLPVRRSAVVLLGAGAGLLPSLQFALAP